MTMNLESLHAQIRKDAETLKQQLEQEARLKSGTESNESTIYPVAPLALAHISTLPTPRPLPDGSIRYRALAAFDGESFVELCYRLLLRHAPDPEGQAFYTRMLLSGKKKAEVVARLRYSHEGRTQAVRIRGLLFPAALAAFSYIPILRHFVDFIVELVCLPRTLRELRWRQAELERQSERAFQNLLGKVNEQNRVLNAVLNEQATPSRSRGE